MRIVDERLWWHFLSVLYAVGLLPYARRRHTRNDAHCRSYARKVLTHHSKWQNSAESYTQNDIFDRPISTVFLFCIGNNK